jgi:hypothetical protein
MSKNDEKNAGLENIVSLAKRRGFIYPGSDVYGGLSGTWDYGPLGVALKRNVMQLWWKMFVDDRDDMYGVDAAILMNKIVWEASGHTATFTDPQVGHLLVSILSARKRLLQLLHSTSGSVNVAVWPLASHTFLFISIAASTPYMSSRSSTNIFHHSCITLRFRATPSGP